MTAATRARRTLVGRSAELSRLVALVDGAAGGSGGCMVVIGDPGSGKTRLVKALADAARTEAIQLRIGRAFDREVARTLGVALDAVGLRLDQLLAPSPPARVRAGGQRHRRDVILPRRPARGGRRGAVRGRSGADGA
jgi:hypothetical protein